MKSVARAAENSDNDGLRAAVAGVADKLRSAGRW